MSEQASPITCATCEACCCRLQVILMAGDDVPAKYAEQDPHGVWVMQRHTDGWCAALDRNTLLCTIYAHRPLVCREYAVGEGDCLVERAHIVTF